MPKILVVDDDPIEHRLLQALFGRAEGFEVAHASDGASGLEAVSRENPDAVLLDLQMPGLDGLEVLRRLQADRPFLPVVMLTGVQDVATALEAVRLGAYHYFTKPFQGDQLLLTVRHALEGRELRTQVQDLRRGRSGGGALDLMAGDSPALRDALDRIRLAAPTGMTVLIQGETGTGKELAARAVHEESPRRDGPFVAVDCGAVAGNLLESELFGHEKGAFSGADRKKQGQMALASDGTLFLDEVGNLPPGLQAKLLRVLQERQVLPVGAERPVPLDVRFVAATNAPLGAGEGSFRQDLYFRLAEFTVNLPPLRDRTGDAVLLARRFLAEASMELRKPAVEFESAALDLLAAHPWPGNVRELRNVVRQAVLLQGGRLVTAAALKKLLTRGRGGAGPVEVPVAPGDSLRDVASRAVEAAERQAISAALQAAGGNKAKAAKALKTDYKTLFLKIKKYKL